MMINRGFISCLALVALISNSGLAGCLGSSSIGVPASAAVEHASGSPASNGVPSSGRNASPSGQSFTLESLKCESVGALTRIVVESSAPPLYTVLRPTEKLIVVDMPGADGSKLSPVYSVKGELVDSIMVRGNAASGGGRPSASRADRVATRIELKVRGPLRDRSSLQGNALVLELSPEDAAASNDPAPAPESSASPSTGVYVYPVPVKPESGNDGAASSKPDNSSAGAKNESPSNGQPGVKSASSASGAAGVKSEARSTNSASVKTEPANDLQLKPAKSLNSVRTEISGGAVRILIEADGLAQYKEFTLTNPSRIVVDIEGVRAAFGSKTIPVGAASVERVRVGQPSPTVVRVVLDASGKVPHNITREGKVLVITVGQDGKQSDGAAAAAAVSDPPMAHPPTEPPPAAPRTVEVASNSAPAAKAAATANNRDSAPKPAGNANTAPAANSTEAAKTASANKTAEVAKTDPASKPAEVASTASAPKTVSNASNSAPAARPNVSANGQKQIASAPPAAQQPIKSVSYSRPAERNPSVEPAKGADPAQGRGQPQRQRKAIALCDPDYVGGPISFDLRSGVDIRDMLRFISQQYGINFIVDKSVAAVPVEMTINDVPWNEVVGSVMRANRLGWVCESDGRILRIATLTAIKDEEAEKLALKEQQEKAKPLETVIRHLRYARAYGSLAGTGGGRSGGGSSGGSSGGFGGGGSGGSLQGAGGGAGGSNRIGLLQIANSRLSPRGHIDVDNRTNSLIITDLSDNIKSIQAIIDQLDKPDPQVEIEARIIVADRNFLRDIGVQLGGAAANTHSGALGTIETAPIIVNPGHGLSSGGQGSGGSGSGSSGSSGGSGGGGSNTNQIAPSLPFPLATNALGATANTVLGLTTGVFGTNILSLALSASETKGQIRTIASPRITAQDNQTAEIVNGVQIPVQTVSNNTVTTTFITAALRLEITPQIVEETGEVSMHVVAENNTVNTALANQFNGGTPGINTQSAESIVRVQDGGTTVMGGINIEQEGSTVNRTPGVSKLPLIGELFKRRTINRDSNEVLFFITPRIVRKDASGALAPQRSSADPQPGDKGRPDVGHGNQPGDVKAAVPAVAQTQPAPTGAAQTQPAPANRRVDAPEPNFAAYVGLSTTEENKARVHSLCVQIAGNGTVEAYQLKDQPGAIAKWITSMRDRFKGEKVAVAIPQTETALIASLRRNNNFLVLYPVEGGDLGKFRQAFSANQARTGAADAAVLKGIAAMYRDKLKPVFAEDGQSAKEVTALSGAGVAVPK